MQSYIFKRNEISNLKSVKGVSENASEVCYFQLVDVAVSRMNPEDLVLPTAKKNGLFCFPFQPHSNNWSSHEIDTLWSPLLVTCLTPLISFKKFNRHRILKKGEERKRKRNTQKRGEKLELKKEMRNPSHHKIIKINGTILNPIRRDY